jgi:hypothetical protein
MPVSAMLGGDGEGPSDLLVVLAEQLPVVVSIGGLICLTGVLGGSRCVLGVPPDQAASGMTGGVGVCALRGRMIVLLLPIMSAKVAAS